MQAISHAELVVLATQGIGSREWGYADGDGDDVEVMRNPAVRRKRRSTRGRAATPGY